MAAKARGIRTRSLPGRGGGARPLLARLAAPAAACAIIAAGLLAYSNSLAGPFIFDDASSIPDNPTIRRLWPIWRVLSPPRQSTAAGRPVLNFSLAVNYAVSGLDVWSYHATNLAIHVLAGLTLFGVIRRTLTRKRLGASIGRAATPLAAICALIWVVHPLHTEAVTYVIQRAESLMGMLYLLTLYCAIRSFTSPRRPWWQAAAVACCALGMGTKEVMVTAPLAVLIYDRLFVARSWRELLAGRWRLYAALAATWVLLAVLVATGPRSQSAGFGIEQRGPLGYAATQFGVILHYLRLAFWPRPLVLDYLWPTAKGFAAIAAPAAGVVLLLAATAAGLRYLPPAGFCGIWFFLVLAPSSSFVPIVDAAFEHRMYLPLAGVVTLVVVGAYALAAAIARRSAAARSSRSAATLLGCALAAAAALALGAATFARNRDYHSDLAIWQDTAAKRPGNFRALDHVGAALGRLGRYDEAIDVFNHALELNANYATCYNNRALAYKQKGLPRQAMRDLDKAIELDGKLHCAYLNRGVVHSELGQNAAAIDDFTKAIEVKNDYATAYANRGSVLVDLGRFAEAIVDLTRAIELTGQTASACAARGSARRKTGDMPGAIVDLTRAIALDDRAPGAYNERGLALAAAGQHEAAVADFGQAIRIDPTQPAPYNNRGSARMRLGDCAAAAADFEAAMKLKPTARYAFNLGLARSAAGDLAGAAESFTKAIELDGNFAPAYNQRGVTLGRMGRRPEAIRNFDKAIELNAAGRYYFNRGLAWQQAGRMPEAIADFDRAIQLEPNFAKAYNSRGVAYLHQGNSRRALADFEKAIALEPTYNRPRQNKARLLALQHAAPGNGD